MEQRGLHDTEDGRCFNDDIKTKVKRQSLVKLTKLKGKMQKKSEGKEGEEKLKSNAMLVISVQ